MKRRFRSTNGYKAEGTQFLNVQSPGGKEPVGLLGCLFKKLERIRAFPQERRDLKQRVRDYRVERLAAAQALGPGSVWSQEYLDGNGLLTEKLAEKQEEWQRKRAALHENSKRLKEQKSIETAQHKKELWERTQNKIQARELEIQSELEMKKWVQNGPYGRHLRKLLMLVTLSSRVSSLHKQFNRNLETKDNKKMLNRSAFLIQRWYRQFMNRKRKERTTGAAMVIQRTLRRGFLTQLHKGLRREHCASNLLQFFYTVEEVTGLRQLCKKLHSGVRLIQRVFRNWRMAQTAKKAILLMQWDAYEKKMQSGPGPPPGRLRRNSALNGGDSPGETGHQARRRRGGYALSNQSFFQVLRQDVGPSLEEQMRRHNEEVMLRRHIKMAVLDTAVKVRNVMMVKDLNEYHKEIDLLMPGWSGTEEQLMAMFKKAMPEMAAMLGRKMSCKPRFKLLLTDEELQGVHKEANYQQKIYAAHLGRAQEEAKDRSVVLEDLVCMLRSDCYKRLSKSIKPNFRIGSVSGTVGPKAVVSGNPYDVRSSPLDGVPELKANDSVSKKHSSKKNQSSRRRASAGPKSG